MYADGLSSSGVPATRTVNGHALSADVSVTKSDLSLGNVDNTTDLNKPISTATQTALDAKVATSRTVNGHALSADVSITKSDLSLGNVPNVDATNPANITEDATHRFATDAEKTAWNAKQSAITFSTGLTNTTGTVTVNTSQNVTNLTNLSTAGLVKTTGTGGALSIATAGTDFVLPGGALGTPASGTLTNCSGLPNTGVTGLGTLSTQNATAVAVTGGAINGTTVGATTPSTGAFTTLAVNGATNINASNNAVTNIGTGTTTSAVTIGNSANTTTIGSATANIGIAGTSGGNGVRIGNGRLAINKPATPPVISSTSPYTLSVQEVLDAGIIVVSASNTLTLPDATTLWAAMPGTPATGDVVSFTIIQTLGNIITTISAGSGGTLVGPAATSSGRSGVAPNTYYPGQRIVYLRFTSSSTYSVY